MKQQEKTTMRMSEKPYLCIGKKTLQGLVKLVETKANATVVCRLEFAGDEFPGQVNLTKETLSMVWDQLDGPVGIIRSLDEIAESRISGENTTGWMTKKLIKSGKISGDKYKDGADSLKDSMWYMMGKDKIVIESPSREVCTLESADGITSEEAEMADIISCSSEMLQLLKKQKVEIDKMIATAEGRDK